MELLTFILLIIIAAFFTAFFKSIFWAGKQKDKSWLDYRGEFDQKYYDEKKRAEMESFNNDIEMKIENIYIPIFNAKGMDKLEAKKMVRAMIKQAKEVSSSHGADMIPVNYGNMLLENEEIDEASRTFLAKARIEGVNDEDIRTWWNMYQLEREMICIMDEIDKIAAFEERKNMGKSDAEAIKDIRKYNPFYGDPKDTTHASGADRPLRYELKDRINKHIHERSKIDPQKFKEEIINATSFNAYIRKKIEGGIL